VTNELLFLTSCQQTNSLPSSMQSDRLESWHCGDRFVSYVAPVIFRLLFTSGLRPQEACNLVDSDVNLDNAEILIRVNKRRKERIVIVSDDMLRLFE
jgi:integrase